MFHSSLGGGDFLFKILDLFYAAGNPPKYWHPQSSYVTLSQTYSAATKMTATSWCFKAF